MHYRCVDSSVDNVLLQTSTSRFLSPINSLLHSTAKTVEWTVIRVVKGYVSGMVKFTDVFFFFFISCCICSVFPGNAATDGQVSWEFEWPFDGQLCQKCLYQKLLKSHYLSPNYYQ